MDDGWLLFAGVGGMVECVKWWMVEGRCSSSDSVSSHGHAACDVVGAGLALGRMGKGSKALSADHGPRAPGLAGWLAG